MAEERIWRPKRSRQSLSIVFIQNVKVLGNSHQPGRNVSAAIHCLSRCRGKSQWCLQENILRRTRYISTKYLESGRDFTAPFCFSLLKKIKFNDLFSAETRNYLCSRSVPRFGMGYLSEIKEGSAYQRDGNRILGEEH